MNGLHLIGDLNNCRCDPTILLDGKQFEIRCIQLVKDSGLTPIESSFHQFEGSGFTGTVVLAESHLAIHTWPERSGLTIDVYVCNYSEDNSNKAKTLFDSILKYFDPEESAVTRVDRGHHFLEEELNDTTGFYTKSPKQLKQIQTKYQNLTVYETEQYGKIFRLDDFSMTSEKDEFIYHESLVHPAMAIISNPKTALIIGGGDGGTAKEIVKYPSIKSVTICELDKDVVEISKEHFEAVHQGVFDDKKVKVLIKDGIKFLAGSKTKYDFITLDLNDPVGPASKLYSEKFFISCKKSLSNKGAMTLHVGAPFSQPDRVNGIVKTLKKVFRNVEPYTVYIPLYGALWMMVVCSQTLRPSDFSKFAIAYTFEKSQIEGLKYYSPEMHESMLILPQYIQDILDK